MKKYLLLLVSGIIIAGTQSALAATATILYNQAVENEEFWTSVKNSGSPDYQKLLSTWCNSLVLGSNRDPVNIYLDSPFRSYEAPAGTQTQRLEQFKIFGNLTLTIRPDGRLSPFFWASDYVGNYDERGGSITIESGASMIVEGSVYSSSFSMKSGASNLTVRDSANFNTIDRFFLGNESSTDTQTMSIEGSNATLSIQRLNFIGSNSSGEMAGGKIAWIADENGFSKLNNIGNVEIFSGSILVDFTNLIWDDAWGDEHSFALLEAQNDSSGVLQAWIDGNADGSLSELIGVSDGEFSTDGYELFLTVQKSNLAIPEPSTYAAIFGALAMLVATYKRRK